MGDYGTILKQQIEDCFADIEANAENKRIVRQIGVRDSLKRCLEAKARYLAQEELKDPRIVALCLSCEQDTHGFAREDPCELPEITRYALAMDGYRLKGLEKVVEGTQSIEFAILEQAGGV